MLVPAFCKRWTIGFVVIRFVFLGRLLFGGFIGCLYQAHAAHDTCLRTTDILDLTAVLGLPVDCNIHWKPKGHPVPSKALPSDD